MGQSQMNISAANMDASLESGSHLSQQCLNTLLVIGGVELNPGPPGDDAWLETQQNILAGLCSEATSNEICDCLRLYRPQNSSRQHKTEFGKCQKSVLVTTLDFLKVPNQDIFKKPACINTLICRIQNLLPDECGICKKEYCVTREEIALLTCEICGQGSHYDCILDMFGVLPDKKDRFTPQDSLIKLNPISLPGQHYLCAACESTTIPDKEAGLLKRNPSCREENSPLQDGMDDNATGEPHAGQSDETHPFVQNTGDTEGDTQVKGSIDTDQVMPTPAAVEQSKEEATNRNQDQETMKRICSYYVKGTCRHGISGKGCPYEHPRPCKRQLKHGNQAPLGCTLGHATCSSFHPKMCSDSISKGECWKTDCRLRHVNGTRRAPNQNSRKPSHRSNGNSKLQTGITNSSESQTGFLGAIGLLRTELLEAIDTKLAVVISTHAPALPAVPQQQQPQ